MSDGDSRGPYCLVLMTEINGDASVCAIPSKWISSDGKSCVWPSHKTGPAQDRLRSDLNAQIEISQWPSFACVIKKRNIMSLKEGRQLEAVYEQLSDTEAEER